MNLPPYAKNED